MSWAYWYAGYNMSARTPPLVSAYKAVTGGRHMAHVCERYNIGEQATSLNNPGPT